MKRILFAIVFALLIAAPVSAQDATPTYSADVLLTQAALEAAIDQLPIVTEVFPAIEVTETVDGGIVINIDTQPDVAPAPAPVPVEPVEPHVDNTGLFIALGGIGIAIAAVGWSWYQHRDITRTLKETNQRVATDAGLQADIKSAFDQQTPATQEGVLRIMQLAALLTSWIPGSDDNQLVANMDAIVRGLPVTPPVQPSAAAVEAFTSVG